MRSSFDSPGAAALVRPVSIPWVIDGGGQPIIVGLQGSQGPIPFDCEIVGVTLFAEQVGSIVIDIWKGPYASLPLSSANSITAAAQPTLTSAQTYQDTTLTGWTVACSAGDWLTYNVVSANALIKRCTVSLTVRKA